MYKQRAQFLNSHRQVSVFLQWIIFFCASLASMSIHAGNKTISERPIIVTTGQWSPLISESSEHHGPISVIVKEAFALSDVNIEFRFLPWKRAMKEVRSERASASSVWRKTKQREEEFLFSEGVYKSQNVFFHLKSKPFDWQRVSDLKKYYIGASLGYAYSKDFEKSEEQGDISVFRVNKEPSLISMLITGRIDVFPANKEVGLELIRTQAPEVFNNVTMHPKSLNSTDLRLVFRKDKKSRALLKKFNAGLLQLKQSGRFDEIYRIRPR